MNVSIILEGSVRVSGDTLRITAQLIEAEKDFHFWSETWNRKLDNIFEIQDEISLLIAEKLREYLGHFEIQEHLVNKQTENFDVYELFLKARFYFRKWNPADVKIAIGFYEKAIELDPKHAESIVGLADCYGFLATSGFMPINEAWGKAAELTYKGLELNDQLADGYYQLANLHFFTECNYTGALLATKKAIEFNPNYVEAQQYLSFLYILVNEKVKARQHLQIAISLDPLSPETLFFSAYFDYMNEDFISALEKLNNCLHQNPKNIPVLTVKCYCLLKLQRYEEVLKHIDQMSEDIISPADKLGIRTLAYALKNDSEKAMTYLKILIEHADTPEGFRLSSYLFFVYAALGDKEKAFEWIRNAIQIKSPLLLIYFVDPLVNTLKSDPRYVEFQKVIFQPINRTELIEHSSSEIKESLIPEYIERLNNHIRNKKPYLDANLSLRSLALQIKILPNELSWLINNRIGKNFNEFVNHYRVQAFKKIIREEKNGNLSWSDGGYKSGFNSKIVFKEFFKKETGTTPKKYVRDIK